MNIDYLKIIGIVLSSLSIILTLYFKNKEKKEFGLFYILKSKNFAKIPSNILDTAEIDNIVHNIILTDFLFFNLGKKTLNLIDLGKVLGLQLVFSSKTDNLEIVETGFSDENNDLKYKLDGNRIKIMFDHIKKNQFIYLRIKSEIVNDNQIQLLGSLIEDQEIKPFSNWNYLVHTIKSYFFVILSFTLVSSTIDEFFHLGFVFVIVFCFLVGYIFIDSYDNKYGSALRKKIKKIQFDNVD